jgi:hypothetical protein
MRASERITVLLLVGFFPCVSVRADLVLESQFDFEARPLHCAYTDLEAQITDTPSPALPLNVPQQYPSYLVSPESRYDLGHLPQTPPPQIAADAGNSSFSLCLSALLSLGLCHSISGVKKLSFGFPPQWYHYTGPSQIGHSIAVDIDSVSPVCCYTQPIPRVTDLALQRHFGTVVSLWRTSQFTPDVIASRGPPATC